MDPVQLQATFILNSARLQAERILERATGVAEEIIDAALDKEQELQQAEKVAQRLRLRRGVSRETFQLVRWTPLGSVSSGPNKAAKKKARPCPPSSETVGISGPATHRLLRRLRTGDRNAATFEESEPARPPFQPPKAFHSSAPASTKPGPSHAPRREPEPKAAEPINILSDEPVTASNLARRRRLPLQELDASVRDRLGGSLVAASPPSPHLSSSDEDGAAAERPPKEEAITLEEEMAASEGEDPEDDGDEGLDIDAARRRLRVHSVVDRLYGEPTAAVHQALA
eukprot:RCo041439